VGDEQRCHARLVHAYAHPVTSDAGLRYFEQSGPDSIAVADTHLVIGKAVDGQVFSELPERKIAATKVTLPIAIGVNLVDEYRPLLAAVTGQVTLTVTVDVQAPNRAPALNRLLADRCSNSLAAPFDLAGHAHIDRQ
jgi:hypothetical protein